MEFTLLKTVAQKLQATKRRQAQEKAKKIEQIEHKLATLENRKLRSLDRQTRWEVVNDLTHSS